jgi:hypothetical protein
MLDHLLRANPGLAGGTFGGTGEAVRFLPALETCRAEVERLEGEADIILLLSDLPLAEQDAIVREMPDIVVFASGPERRLDERSVPSSPGGAVIEVWPMGGHGVDVTHLTVSPAGHVVQFHSVHLLLRADISAYAELDARTREITEAKRAGETARQVRRHPDQPIIR